MDQAPVVQAALGGIGQTLRFEVVENPAAEPQRGDRRGLLLLIMRQGVA